MSQLLGLVTQIAGDNQEIKAKQALVEKKLGEITLKQQETAQISVPQSAPQQQVHSAETERLPAEKRKASSHADKEEEGKRRKASQKISKSKKAQEEAQKEQEEEPAKKTVSLSRAEYMDRLKDQTLPCPIKKYSRKELDDDQVELAQMSAESPFVSSSNMREVFLCKRAWGGYCVKLTDQYAWIEWQKERYAAELKLEAGKVKSDTVITRIQLAIADHEQKVPVTTQYSHTRSLWYREWGEVLTLEKWSRLLWFLQDKLGLTVKVAEEVLYFYFVHSERQLKEEVPARNRVACIKLAIADLLELQLNWELWGNSKGKVLGD